MLAVLAVSTLAAFAGALLLLWSDPAAPLPALHVAFAAGVMPLILGAMSHFVPVLTRSRAPGVAVRALPLLALGAGGLAALAFALPARVPYGLDTAAGVGAVAALGMAGWIHVRGRRALDRPHPGLHWYTAAAACLLLALVAVLAMRLVPEQRLALRHLHLHLNTLGFIALTAVGTLQVLLPTAAGRADPAAAPRLRRDLKWAVTGTLLVAAGSAWTPAFAWAGLGLWVFVLTPLAAAWLARFRADLFALHGAAAALGAALIGLGLVLLAGALHGAGLLPATHAVTVFFLAFLLPLVTGAVSQLLPLWLRPGGQTHWHETLRARLGRFSGVRALLFLAGGALAALGLRAGLVLALAGLLLFGLQAARALWSAGRLA